ncbi:MAG TPA: hypothetical protein VK066_20375 [Chloroflexota bacterium]|nr:hypothetical protein [Chloroflexota bacterium]
MVEQQWRMRRGAVQVWQRLPHGPRPGGDARAQARPARRGGRPLAGGLATAGVIVALVAGWAHV